ncbi:methanogen output domain 1-containing protein [Roseitranquillus sediminis]|uniref:methanogen output domain 1-containing protein n=1 Tax=Roseitranquillus sediminis TaxID=2809051 RepID=UPI001D0BF51D|nr:methanogen output domain 1-containing protein [Roseitranquillus sediminis]MBM9595006.1 transcriptional regulator [Roseitranquillus sediminis]
MTDTRPAAAELPLEGDIFMRRLLRELSGLLEDVVGTESAEGYISGVGSIMGRWIGEQYRGAIDLECADARLLAEVLVDLKRRIGGEFHIIAVSEDRIVLGNARCPFGDMVQDRPSLCMMTSNVFGRIVADSLGYARVELQETIAAGHGRCRVVVHLEPRRESAPGEMEYFSTRSAADAREPEPAE